MAPNAIRRREAYTVGIVCALAIEKAAAIAMLDDKHERLPPAPGDENDYTFGTIGAHGVVIACLPAGTTGTVSAAVVARDMSRSFPIRIGLMVGVAGGVWSEEVDVRLGDVVVSRPNGQHGGVMQWDSGKTKAGGKFRRTGTLNKPPRELLNAVHGLQAEHLLQDHLLETHLSAMLSKYPAMKTFVHQGHDEDELFEASYDHARGNTCGQCARSRVVQRAARPSCRPYLHYGSIASGNEVMKDGRTRDRIAQQEGVICFEMEAAGLMDSFPCLVIRGICDYADSHKNKRWQPYAAATAAAYARELLLYMPVSEVAKIRPVREATDAEPYGFSLPFSLHGMPTTDYFVPRKVEMQYLSEFFATTSTQSAQQRVFVVYGTGGMGKTQLCAKFSETNVERFSAVFWLDGSSKDALRRSMASAGSRVSTRTNALSAEMDIAQLIDDFRQWLSLSGNAHWLMVIDNIDRDWQGKTKDEQAYDYREFLPHAYHGNILITTRLRRLQRPKASLHLDTADDELAKEMVETRANRAVTNIDQLLPKLGGLPLALAQAGAYLSTTGMSVADYLEHYDATWAELMQKQDQFPLQEYGERSVLTTWTMSYEQVKSRDPLAAQLLDLWAFLYHGDVWAELLLTGQSDEAQHRPREDAVFRPVTKLSLQHSIGTLVQYSMVKMSTADRAPAIHPVVHAWCLHSLDRSTAQQLQAAALRLVARMAESAGRGVAKDLGLRLAAHAKVIGTRVATWRSDEAQQALEYHQVAHFLKDWETSQEVENLYMRALRGYEKAWGAEHTSTLDTVNSLGLLYADQGKMAEAEEMYMRALRGYGKAWGAEHTSTLSTVNNLGNLYASQGKMAEAEEMYMRALRGYEKAWGAEHTSTLDTVNNLGALQDGGGGGDVSAGAAWVREAVMGPAGPYRIRGTVLVLFAPTIERPSQRAGKRDHLTCRRS
ncbi:purine and uridine phosphorylase [Dissoconium aciculare CBS 342.82]|uniref:Purine and uridine phosphorylase n=1 Tax=Dissoconium aciculare CBS 342.82 TaxID=1314786 RepID=A0A6J3LYJ1_9PEZI|nr:purine and uridine phosphorylase [Dissoconium aciculare CBS 342.82]KAF1819697.1 purine and uridine phosphorylase [Dissoconium aciculare CBS 342.82]